MRNWFVESLRSWVAALCAMEERLGRGPFLVSGEPSLADFAFAPYMSRLDELGISWLCGLKTQAWWVKLRAMPSWSETYAKWVDPSCKAIWDSSCIHEWPVVQEIIAREGIHCARSMSGMITAATSNVLTAGRTDVFHKEPQAGVETCYVSNLFWNIAYIRIYP